MRKSGRSRSVDPRGPRPEVRLSRGNKHPCLSIADPDFEYAHAVGLFGVSVGPLTVSEYAGLSNSGVLGVVVWQLGLPAFLLLSATAAHRAS